MPDISMCKNEKCKLKEYCYRFKAKPSPFWQSYSGYIPNKEKGSCEAFIELKELKK